MKIEIAFTEKELQVIALFAPPKSAEEIINIVLRDWFNVNATRMYETVKTPDERLDEIISVHSKGKNVVK